MAEADMLRVSVVVLAWNAAEDLTQCLDEIGRSRGVELEVIVVDNASDDGSADVAGAHATKPAVIRNAGNLGCAGGNNVGWRAARHPFVVFVNPDCMVERDAIRLLVEPLARDASVGMTGAKLYYPNSRRIQHAGGSMAANGIASHPGANLEDDGTYDADRACDYVTGALFAVRRPDLAELGGFDEEYFPAYYEETDLCARLRARGKRILYVADAVGFHRESSTLGGRVSPALARMSSRCRMIYLVKTTSTAELLGRTIPAELRYFLHPDRRGWRTSILRSWASGAGFALKCVLRGRRRPKK